MGNNRLRTIVLVLCDIFIVNALFLLTRYLHLEGELPSNMMSDYLIIGVVLTGVKVLLFYRYRLYTSVWEFASIEELIGIIKAVTIGFIIEIFYFKLSEYSVYLGMIVFSYLFEIAGIASIRFSYRIFRRIRLQQSIWKVDAPKNTLIVGSGSTGCMISREIIEHPEIYGKLIGFIDQDESKLNKNVAGVKVVGNLYDLFSVVKRFNINEVIIALPTVDSETMNRVIADCELANVSTKVLPGVREVIGGQTTIGKLKDIGIEELLGYNRFKININKEDCPVSNKTILVTGGGGAVGSELCRFICQCNPKRLIILDIYENGVYDLQNELKGQFPNVDLDIIIASVRERKNIFRIVDDFLPDIIYHCAGYKYSSFMNNNPMEAFKNNVFGTMNLADAAKASHISKFIYVSTIKVYIDNDVLGLTGKICERLLSGMNSVECQTDFISVRLGKLIGLEGSVIQTFREQIKLGGPVTVTHRDMERVYSAIPEAVELLVTTSGFAKGGEVYVFDLGCTIRIYDLALKLIKLSGFKPNEDIEVKFIGPRPGEMIQKKSPLSIESLISTKVEGVYLETIDEYDYNLLREELEALEELVDSNELFSFYKRLKKMVPEFEWRTDEVELMDKVTSLDRFRSKK